MLNAALLHDLVEYNYRAIGRQLDACAGLSEADRTRTCGGSFESLDATLGHLFGAEKVWLARWRGTSPAALEPVRSDSIDGLRTMWAPVEEGMKELAGTLDDAALARPITYTKLNGEQWTYPLWTTLGHLMNHQSYHRGQVTLLLRQLGKVPPPVDLLVWQDLRG